MGRIADALDILVHGKPAPPAPRLTEAQIARAAAKYLADRARRVAAALPETTDALRADIAAGRGKPIASREVVVAGVRRRGR